MKTKHAAIIDMTGERYGRLLVLSYHGKNKQGALWNCVCDCGNPTIGQREVLKRGHKQSCGCLRKEMAKPHRQCPCGGRYVSYGSHTSKVGVTRKALYCRTCDSQRVDFWNPDGTLQRTVIRGRHGEAPVPESNESIPLAACSWFSTLPVAGCVSLR